MREGTVSLVVLMVAFTVTILSLPDVPGVHSLSEDSRTRHMRTHKRHRDGDESDVPEIRDNFPAKVNRFLCYLIVRHLEYSYQYLHMAYYFDRSDVALPGFHKYFLKASEREMNNADFLMTYINKRGGSISLSEIDAPRFRASDNDKAALRALKIAFAIESDLNQKLHKVHSAADNLEDPVSKHVLEEHLMGQKVNVIKELEDHVQRLSHMAPAEYPLGLFMYDKDL